LIIQLTDRCNATCPQCGMNIHQRYARHRLARDDVRRMIDAAAQRGVAALSFTGGEPLMVMKDLVALIHHAGAAGIPFIRTGTNGFCFRSPEKPGFSDRIHRLAETLAATPLRNFWISIDAADPPTHERMRGFRGVIRGIEKAIPIFHAYGLYPSANLGINRNLNGRPAIPFLAPGDPATGGVPVDVFRQRLHEGFGHFFRFVAGLGFSIANVCYPMSIDEETHGESLNAVYGATAASAIVSFSDREKGHLFDVLRQSIAENRSHLRIFTPLCALEALQRQFRRGERGYSCRGGKDFFFVDAVKGHAFPCGYRGDDDMGPFRSGAARTSAGAGDCFACEWECFRDPSELGGPLLDMLQHPLHGLRLWRAYPQRFQIWLTDLRYYRDCDFFDGRRPPKYDRLRRYRRKAPGEGMHRSAAA
jgi:MoaA/NifB/PqqE/SkfB family radical SAM enzyme